MRINILETALDGHRARYLRDIILGLKEVHRECDVRLCLFPRLLKSGDYLEYLKPLEEHFRFVALPDLELKGTFRSEFTRVLLLRQCVRKEPCDRVIIPFGEGLVPLLGVLPECLMRKIVPSATQIETMLFRADWVYPADRRYKDWYQRVRRWAVCRWPGWRIHLSDYNAYQRACAKVDRYTARVSLVPEVLEPWSPMVPGQAMHWLLTHGYLDAASDALDWSLGVVSSPGPPSMRKGAVELIEALVLDRALPCILLLWGAIPADVELELSKRKIAWREDPRILVIDKYITQDAFRALFSITDLIVLPYQFRLSGVSSIYLLSVVHRKQTVCDNRAWMGWASEYYQHGFATDCSRPQEIQRALRESLSRGAVRVASEQTAGRLRAECMTGLFGKCWAMD
jgi:hypothetical protein